MGTELQVRQLLSYCLVHANDRFELEFLRKEVVKLSEQLGVHQDDVHSGGSEMVSDPSDEEDYVDELPETLVNKNKKGPRTSVSAEAYGDWNQKENFKPIFVEKTQEVKERIH